MKTIKMKCQNCNGLLEMDADKEIIFCPYCGMKTLIVQDNEVQIAKIKADADVSKIAKIEERKSVVEIEKIKNDKHRINAGVIETIVFIIFITIMMIIASQM